MLTHAHLPILKAARQIVESGEQHFICFALEVAATSVEGDAREAHRLADECCNFISRGIKPHAYLTEWIRAELLTCGIAPVPWWLDLKATAYCAPRREEAVGMRTMMRLAWLDRIIHDIEKEPA